MKSRLRHILLGLLFASLCAVPVQAQVSGSAEWNWADFSRDSEDNSEDVDASHFVQSYSLLYETKNLINHGRAGEWSVALGYEWTSLSTSINDEDQQIDSGKILYRGELLFAPGGLPLRVHAYSYDQTKSIPVLFDQEQLVAPRIATDLNFSGQEIVSGLTLLAGIKNGSYMGQYREVLSQIPKLLIDYRQTYSRSLDSIQQTHTRLRDLAFISLNKKDNWFHYRVSEYEDFEDSKNNYEDRIYMIGTVDHTLARQWINLTNWIQLSVDGSLEQYQDEDGQSDDTYRLNLFTKFQRKSWNLHNFNRYERTLEENGDLEKRFEVPVFASGEIDPRKKWRMSLIHSSEEDLSADPDLPLFNEHLTYLTYQLEEQRSSGLIMTGNAALDIKRGSLDDEGQAVKVGLEMRTDQRRDLNTAWLANYSVALFNGQTQNDSYLEQEFSLAVDAQLSPTVRYGGRERLALGSGGYQAYSTEYLKPVLSTRVDYAQFSDSDIDGTSWRSQTELYLELLSSSRWKNRFSLNLDYMDRSAVTTYNLQLDHVATYSTPNMLVNMRTIYETGDFVDLTLESAALGGSAQFLDRLDEGFSHVTTVSYSPQRAWRTGAEAAVSWGKGEKGSAGLFHLEQNASYSLYSSGGARRKLISLDQEFVYERLFGDVEGNPWYTELNLASRWHPYRFLSLGARGEFRHYGDSGANVFEYALEAEIPFDKFQVIVSYEYGQADEGWRANTYYASPELVEQRWEVDIKKTF